MVSTVSSMMERSLSFKNWEADLIQAENSVVGEAQKTAEKISSPRTSIINRPSQTVSLSIQTQPPESYLPPSLIEYCSPKPKSQLDAAATYVQKVFKSYRTRRNLADCAVVVEEFWWKALDFTSLQLSSVSFFDVEKPQTAVSRWTRATNRLAKVGKGLSKDEKAQSLALQHWLEAIDPRHRYGHNLHFYYDVWSSSESHEPFFWWLDIGEGKEVNLEKCPRSKLQHQLITYLGPKEREAYEVIVDNGKLVYKLAGIPVNTTEGSKWIFVLSTSRTLYVGQKKKGSFQHSSFLAGASTTAAGRLVAEEGVIKAIWPYSGHYLPTEQNFREFISFLEEYNVDLTDVKKNSTYDDEYSSSFSGGTEPETEVPETLLEPEKAAESEAEVAETEEQKAERAMALEMNRPLTCRWTTGTGARIGCVRDYPAELQSMALEHVNLSPVVVPSPASTRKVKIPSPRPSPKMRLSPRLQYMGMPMPSPRPSPQTRLSPHIQLMGMPMPSPRVSPQNTGARNSSVLLTLPKHMRG